MIYGANFLPKDDGMPLSYKIEDGIVYTTTIGRIGFQEQMNFIWGWISDPDRPNPIRVLRDDRKMAGSYEQLEKVIDFFNKYMPPIRVAIVVRNDLRFGVDRVLKILVDDAVHNYRVFGNIEEAHEWLLQDDTT